ncbi:MAG: transketolase, partial [Verrucomicrobia bacterium]|nr:transketolase [Verrucomicrobiota bacterium]
MTLDSIAREIRKDVVRMHRRGSNVGSAMSAVDILTALYFDRMHLPSPDDPARDRFILSKGHAAAALYATLAQKGFIDRSTLTQFLADGSPLMGHPCAGLVPGVELSTGSLGHGLALTVGMALAAA